jgi:16S rRNA (uracil1498-N3)-methyltransferase
MPHYDFKSPRLHVEAPLQEGAAVTLVTTQMHYLMTVLRLNPGDGVLVFNGRDGEWLGRLQGAPKGGRARSASLVLEQQTREQTTPADLHYLFAPLKRARLDYMVQKAVELGVSVLQPATTRYTQAERVNIDRMHANTIEAAEQCGILNIPVIRPPLSLPAALAGLEAERLLVFCDEDAPVTDPIAALRQATNSARAVAVLIGPEGGFAEEERTALLARANTVRIALGPRILRADTAAIAALSLVQAVLGDWRS